MDKVIYTLCALTSLTCAVLLLRTYWQTSFRLLLWSGLCFVGLAFNNALLVLDRVMMVPVELSTWRLGLALVSLLLLIAGLVLQSDE
ncbi:MAG: hypothetical protein EOP38_22890 [Rubrivivax sp.]|nr:MAG: hypothetical protein EOP38_22890 [Rubrivivax sp.]